MDYGTFRSHFKELLNRDDCTDALADTFIAQGFRRATRVLRIPTFRVSASFTVDDTFDTEWPYPTDFIGVYSVTVNGGRVPRTVLGQEATQAGFRTTETGIEFEPALDEEMEVSIVYYSLSDGVTDDTDVPVYEQIEDVILYASLVFAASYFIDTRKAEFESDFTTLFTEVQRDSDVDALTLSAVNPMGDGVA